MHSTCLLREENLFHVVRYSFLGMSLAVIVQEEIKLIN